MNPSLEIMGKSIKRMVTMHRMQVKGLELFYAKGYYNTSVDDILKELSLSKGAFYYHFKSKEDFFVGIIHNLIAKKFYNSLMVSVDRFTNPLNAVYDCLEQVLEGAIHNEMDNGCVLGNFISEFNGKNDTILQHLNDIVYIWEVNLVTLLQNGKSDGYINRHIDCEGIANYLMSSYFGIRTLMSSSSPKSRKYRFMTQLKHYFKTLESKNIIA